MKRSILILAAIFTFSTAMVSCRDAERDNDEVDMVEEEGVFEEEEGLQEEGGIYEEEEAETGVLDEDDTFEEDSEL